MVSYANIASQGPENHLAVAPQISAAVLTRVIEEVLEIPSLRQSTAY
jgi:hypothetical protein